jgi:hypothetical protein
LTSPFRTSSSVAQPQRSRRSDLGSATGCCSQPPACFTPRVTVAYGLTVFTNSVEGGTAVLGLLSGAVFVAWGLRGRRRLPELLVPAYAVTLACLIGWGLYWCGFPQFSELGWV